MPRTQAKNRNNDHDVQVVLDALRNAYGISHAEAQISAKRRNHSIRIRIIDPGFRGLSLGERDDLLSKVLETFSENLQSQITMLLLLTPEEARSDLLNMEFDDPRPSPTWPN